NLNVTALVIDPSTPDTLYAGIAGIGGGVYKSTNGGTSWRAVKSGLADRIVDTLVIDPSTPSTLYAGTNDYYYPVARSGVYKSTNGGTSWTAMSGLTNIVNVLTTDPSTPDTLYAGTNGGGVFKSTDGSRWIAMNSGLRNSSV